jgi:LysM repeat protein
MSLPAAEAGSAPANLDPERSARSACPYLLAEDRRSRRATAWRGHRCTAITPASQLALDKQRRLCLVAEHRTCATFLAARAGGPSEALGWAVSPDAVPELEPVTRWSIVRTTPTVLDAGSPVSGVLERMSGSLVQVILAGLLLVALLAIGLGQLRLGAGPTGSASPTVEVSQSPSVTSTLAPTGTPVPSPTPTGPSPTPIVTASPAPPPSPAGSGTTYVVQSGDTLWAIANRFGTTVRAIQDLNGLGDSTRLHVGQVLAIP